MTQATEGMLSKIRGLLAQAEHEGTSKTESETFMAAATRLMAKYGVERAMLGALHPETDRVADKIIVVPAPYAASKLRLLWAIASALGADGVKRRAAKGTAELHLFGMESDLERIDLLYTSMLLQCQRFQEIDWRTMPSFVDKRTWKVDYVEGFRSEVHRRLKEVEARAKQQAQAEQTGGPSVDLVLADRSALVQKAKADAYSSTRKSSYSRRVGAGYGQGTSAGQRADLGGSRIAGNRRSLSR
ncbi:DUF2786 domain-containing protein [Micromonospora sp. NPDC049240]|uniref:DUF2786 domain-containing protein n=1 Tax=Micromonospora sp. NPDC049240 TaxID=3155151 RepID=UPI0033F5C56B